MKIQMTQTTQSILAFLGGFHMELRGEVPVKGKGTLMTFWLLGTNQSDEGELLAFIPSGRRRSRLPSNGLPPLWRTSAAKQVRHGVSQQRQREHKHKRIQHRFQHKQQDGSE
ncbi:hypothetical protein BV898_08154 [Hypsibius exemplaris]|nr:hypothetical protein BV898_08154 [Hypsibius exemplaris]